MSCVRVFIKIKFITVLMGVQKSGNNIFKYTLALGLYDSLSEASEHFPDAITQKKTSLYQPIDKPTIERQDGHHGWYTEVIMMF